MAETMTSAPEALGRLAGLVDNLPRDEFGEQHALAVTAAYRKVESVIMDELRRVCREGT